MSFNLPPLLNTSAKANLSVLTRDELHAFVNKMDGDDVMTRDELLEIAETLYANDKNSLDNHMLTQMIYYLKNQPKVNIKHIQNALTDYATRARDGKVGGYRSISKRNRKNRKTRKTPRRVRRTRRRRI
jgi:hypothetical protein